LALPAVDRIGIQNDAFALTQAGHLETAQALIIAKSYTSETDYNVWADLIQNNLRAVKTVWSGEPNYPNLQRFIINLIKPVGQRLGWDVAKGESDLNTLLRAMVIESLVGLGEESVIAEAKKRFHNFINNNVSIPADLRYAIYKVMASSSEEGYEAILKIYRTADLHEEKLRALRALSSNQTPHMITRSLEFSLSSEVREQDIVYSFIDLTDHNLGREAGWKFFKDNFSKFNEKIGSSGMLFDRLIKFVTSTFSSIEKAQEIKQFFDEHPVPVAERTIRQSLEEISASAKWLKNNRENVAKFLNEY